MPPEFKAPVIKAPVIRPPVIKRPPLPSLARVPDPLKDIAVPDDIEEAAAVELDAMSQGFRDRAAAEAARFAGATDGGFYTCVVFENRAQCDAFIARFSSVGKSDLYLDGRDICHQLGIELPPGGGGGSPGRIDGAFARIANAFRGGK